MKLFLLILLTLPSLVLAQTRSPATCGFNDVNNAVNGNAANGGTNGFGCGPTTDCVTPAPLNTIINIPQTGSPATWNSVVLRIKTPITLHGAVTVTVRNQATGSSYTSGGPTIVDSQCNGTLGCINITNELPDLPVSCDDNPLGTGCNPVVIEGLEFLGTNAQEGVIKMDLSSQHHLIKIHNCHFGTTRTPQLDPQGLGVIYNNYFDSPGKQQSMQPKQPTWIGLTGAHTAAGDGSWNDYPYYGSARFLFVEDNYFDGFNGGGAPDNYSGSRAVYRFNVTRNVSLVAIHGTETSQRQRGSRAIEVYQNDEYWDIQPNNPEIRSGGALYHDNRYHWTTPAARSDLSKGTRRINVYRFLGPFNMWGGANGLNPIDDNDTTGGDGTGLYYAGRATQDSALIGGKPTLTDSNATGWTPNRWAPFPDGVGYVVVNKDAVGGTGSQGDNGLGNNFSGAVVSNSATQITFESAFPDTFQPTFASGAHYEIRRVNMDVDQVGAGRGDLITQGLDVSSVDVHNNGLSNAFALKANPKQLTSLHQHIEPAFYFGNTIIDENNLPVVTPVLQVTSRGSFVNGTHFFSQGYSQAVNGGANLANMVSKYNAVPSGESLPLNGLTMPSTGQYTHPHPLTGGVGPTPTPGITSANATSFNIGNAANTFKVQTSNFNSLPTITEVGTLPTAVTFVDNRDFSATISGSATGAIAGPYPITIKASNATETAPDQSFTLTVVANQLPNITAFTATPNAGTAPLNVSLSATASDPDGSVAQVQFYENDPNAASPPAPVAVLLGTDNTPPSPFTLALTGVVAGTHKYYAVATDNLGGTKTSSPISVAVQPAPGASPTPATIIIKGASSALKTNAKGIFLLQQGQLNTGTGNSLANSAGIDSLNQSYVEGVRIKTTWANVETADGTYDWSFLDAAVAYVHSKGKICGIDIGAGIKCPAWLYTSVSTTPGAFVAGDATHAQGYVLQDTSGNGGLQIPVPGDPVFLAQWTTFLNAFGARYNSNPDVRFIVIAGIGNHDEWNTADGNLDTAALGNTTAKCNLWQSSAIAVVHAYAAAFPNTIIEGSLQKPFSGSSPIDAWTLVNAVTADAVANYRSQFCFFFSGLNPNTTTSYEPANQINLNWPNNPTGAQQGPVGQQIFADVDGELTAAENIHCRYVELYNQNISPTTNNVGAAFATTWVPMLTSHNSTIKAFPPPTP